MDRAIVHSVMQVIPIAAAIAFIGVSYFVITIDRTRPNSPSKDDTQVGIKLVIWAFIIAGVGLATGGVDAILAYVLGGFKASSLVLRGALGPLVVGAGVVVLFWLVLLPKTNNASLRQCERYALGVVGFAYGIQAVVELSEAISGVFTSAAWGEISGSMSGALVHGAVGFLAIVLLGSRSGWTSPPPPMRMPYPPPQQQGGGYPPQGGGYPPQGGGYPPQGGGYPPQGGGYPPPA